MRLSDKNNSQHCKLFPQLFAIYYAFAFLFEEKLSEFWVRNNGSVLKPSCKSFPLMHIIS